MNHFLKVMIFAILLIIIITAYSNFGIPGIQPEAPPVHESIDLSNMNMPSFIILGEQLYKGKGTCSLCHNATGGRAPMLEQLAEVTQSRIENDNYNGQAANFEEYLYESLVEPSAHVVSGFGKVGHPDESPMPSVRAGSIGLSEPEILAVIAYLQDLNGVEITIEIPGDAPQSAQIEEPPNSTVSSAKSRPRYQSADEIIAALDCGACHTLGVFQSQIGPDLSQIGGLRNKEHLRKSILYPNADITEGYVPMMPPAYGDQLYASELELLVDYMSGLK